MMTHTAFDLPLRGVRRAALGLAALLLGGCREGDLGAPGAGRDICFEEPLVARPTRTGERAHTSGLFPETWGFTVAAVKHTGNFVTWDEEDLYFATGTAAYKDEYKAWVVKASWPTDGDLLSFQAFCPSSWTGAAVGPTGVTCDNCLLATDGTQPDLLYSDRTTNQREPDLTYIYKEDGRPAVQLHFHHALANLRFHVRLRERYEGWTFSIRDIHLTNMAVRGSFAQNLAANATSGGAPRWTASTSFGSTRDYDNIVTAAEGFVVPFDPAAPATYYSMDAAVRDLLVMPQEFTDVAYLVVDYQIDKAATPDQPAKVFRQTHKVALKNLLFDNTEVGELAWKGFEPGKQYDFHLQIERTKIRFQPVASGVWDGLHIKEIDNEGSELS